MVSVDVYRRANVTRQGERIDRMKKPCSSRTARLWIWRGDRDSNPRYPCGYNGFRIRPVRPLRHLPWAARMIPARMPLANPPRMDFFVCIQVIGQLRQVLRQSDGPTSQQARRVSASRYLSAVFCATSSGSDGAGGCLFQPVDSSQSRTNCLSKLGGFRPSI